MIALPFFIPTVCKQKDRLFIKTPVSTVYGSGPVFQKTGFLSKLRSLPYMEVDRSFKRPAFYQKSRLYLIWKWTGLSKDRLFIKNPVFTLYGSGPVFQKTGFLSKIPSLPYMEVDRCFKNPTFHQKPGFLTQNSLFFKVIKRLNQSFHFFHQKKHDYKHVR